MEALTISAANLDTIEKNLHSVAQELTGVITNVSDVNNQVTKVEAEVNTLNNEVKGLVKEIRETTIITNARQSIMYNNSQIEKKYGYFDEVRRTTESLLSAINNSNISADSLMNLNQDLILHNPNYWLANALAALSYWLLDDKENTDKELNNALKKDESKTSLFFCLINDTLGRKDTAINWLNKYLSIQNPVRLDNDFITVLDLVATGTFGDDTKKVVLNKLNIWLERINSNREIIDETVTLWKNFLRENEDTYVRLPNMEKYCPDVTLFKTNLQITSIYNNILDKFRNITKKESSNKSKEEILNNLIYDYEKQENQYQKDNLRNNLIIECNGNRELADNLFKKQESVFDEENNILNLLSTIIIYKDTFHVSNETQKLAIAVMKPFIIEAIKVLEEDITHEDIKITVDNFITHTKDGLNKEEIQSEIKNYVTNYYKEDDKSIIIPLIIIDILGIIALVLTMKSTILSTILIIILIISNIFLIAKLNNTTKLRNYQRQALYNNIYLAVERVLADVVDCRTLEAEDMVKKNELLVFLNGLRPENFASSNNERNIDLGE